MWWCSKFVLQSNVASRCAFHVEKCRDDVVWMAAHDIEGFHRGILWVGVTIGSVVVRNFVPHYDVPASNLRCTQCSRFAYQAIAMFTCIHTLQKKTWFVHEKNTVPSTWRIVFHIKHRRRCVGVKCGPRNRHVPTCRQRWWCSRRWLKPIVHVHTTYILVLAWRCYWFDVLNVLWR